MKKTETTLTIRAEQITFCDKNGNDVTFVQYTLLDVNGIDVVVKPKDDTGKQVLATLLNK